VAQPIVCFTSDFGTGDTWVGVCHAVIYAACPSAHVVDLDHHIAPFDIRKAAAIAAAGVWQLPGAIHLVVVDPGVGGPRRDLLIVTGDGTALVGPDNGVLVPATWRAGGVREARAIASKRTGLGEPLGTFHARDVLAPAAAALACGAPAAALGDPVDPADLAAPPFLPARQEAGTIVGEVIDVDRFGSARMSISGGDLSASSGESTLEIAFGHSHMELPFARTFSDVGEGEPVALIDSSGWLTIAVRLGSAVERYGIEPGAIARVRLVR
jgi:hypothetical protein